MKKKPITTPFGQWQYPGAVTRIPSNTITMENVPYPVIGVDDLGVTKMMMPGGGYVFPGSAVTEYPVMGSGGEMIRRADGSYSRRGMWDNIRDNKGSGKKPTREMLAQERKIRAQEKKKGGSVQDREMVEGVADILRRVKDLENRQELARYMTSNFEDENVSYDRQEFMEDVDLDEMKNGGIPERYKNMGFTKVGVKKQSTSAGKKWMVLAKKGDKYKVVHGGYKGMKDYTQHGSENRRERFWDRMGGRDSAKAKDPFSPLYWHKRFGTWAEGGETVDDYQFGGPSQMPASLAAYLQRPENIQEAKQRIEDERKGFTYENRVNRALGNPKRAAAALAESDLPAGEDPRDNVRHSAAGMYTTQAMRNYLMERGVPAGAASTMGVIGSNIAGAAHEVKAFPASLEGDYRNIPAAARMTAEDMFNNLTGSLVGVNPFMTQSEREQFLLNASDNNMLPDGYERMPYSKKPAPANMYFKKNGGAFYQDGGPTFDESIRDRVVNAANKIIETNDYYKLSPEKAAVVKANKSNPNELTCIGGVCRVLKEEGVLPEIIESNTDFAQNAEQLGFSKPSFNLSRLKPGDVIQHFGRRNSSGKGYPTHAQMYMGQDEKGNYKFFDNYRGTSQWHGGKGYKTYSENDLKKFLSKGTEGSVDGAQLFHMNPNAERDYVTKEEIAMRESKDASRARRLPVETYKDNLYSDDTYKSEIINTQDLPYAYVPKEDASANERELLKLFNNPEFDKKLRETFLVSDQTLEKVKPLIYGVMKQESNFGNPDTAGRSAKYLLENLVGAEKWSTGPAAVRYRDLRNNAKELLGNDSKNLQTIAGAYVGALDSLLTAGSISDSYQMNNPELADKDPWSAALYFYNGQGRSLKRGTTKSGERLQVDAGSYPDKIFQNAESLQRFVPFDANLADPDVYMNPYDVLITPEEQMTAKKELAKGGQPCYTCGGGVMKNGGWADGLVQFIGGGGTQYLPKPVNPGESMTINRNYNVSEMKDPLRQNMKTMGAATLNPYMYAMTPENFGAFSGIADIAKAAGALSNVGLGYSKLFNPSRAATFTDASGKQTTYNVMNNRQHDRELQKYNTPEMMQVAPSVPMFPTVGPAYMQNDPMMAQFGAEVQPTFEEWLQQTGQELMMGSEGMLYKQYQDFLGNNRSQMPVAAATPAQTNVSSKTRFSTMGDPQGQALAFGTSAALSSIANNRNYRDMQQLYEQRTQELGNTDNRFDVGFTGYNPFGDYTLNRAQGMNMMPNRTNGVRDSGNNFSYGFGKNASSMKNGGQYEEGGEYEMNDQELAAFLAAGGQVEYL